MAERKNKTTPLKKTVKGGSAIAANRLSKGAENEAGDYPSLGEIRELIEFVSKKDFNEFELERGGFRLRWRKGLSELAAPSGRLNANALQPVAESRPVEVVA